MNKTIKIILISLTTLTISRVDVLLAQNSEVIITNGINISLPAPSSTEIDESLQTDIPPDIPPRIYLYPPQQSTEHLPQQLTEHLLSDKFLRMFLRWDTENRIDLNCEITFKQEEELDGLDVLIESLLSEKEYLDFQENIPKYDISDDFNNRRGSRECPRLHLEYSLQVYEELQHR